MGKFKYLVLEQETDGAADPEADLCSICSIEDPVSVKRTRLFCPCLSTLNPYLWSQTVDGHKKRAGLWIQGDEINFLLRVAGLFLQR